MRYCSKIGEIKRSEYVRLNIIQLRRINPPARGSRAQASIANYSIIESIEQKDLEVGVSLTISILPPSIYTAFPWLQAFALYSVHSLAKTSGGASA